MKEKYKLFIKNGILLKKMAYLMYRITEPVCCAPETNITSYINYTQKILNGVLKRGKDIIRI